MISYISVCFSGNPPNVVYFNCSLLSVIWRINYYYYYCYYYYYFYIFYMFVRSLDYFFVFVHVFMYVCDFALLLIVLIYHSCYKILINVFIHFKNKSV